MYDAYPLRLGRRWRILLQPWEMKKRYRTKEKRSLSRGKKDFATIGFRFVVTKDLSQFHFTLQPSTCGVLYRNHFIHNTELLPKDCRCCIYTYSNRKNRWGVTIQFASFFCKTQLNEEYKMLRDVELVYNSDSKYNLRFFFQRFVMQIKVDTRKTAGWYSWCGLIWYL